MRIQNRLAISIAAIVATAAPAVGAAQLEEITVTAQYRAENVQDVPIAITAMSGDMMAKADIYDLTGIAERTPGLTYMEFSPGQTIPSLRGISSADDGAGLDNSAALFLDGVYIGRSAGINFDMYDLERVEVLRGPQGTLFGRNAIGGAISVVSAKPSQETRLKAGITAGNEGIFRAQALASGGLTDNLAGKLTVSHRQHDGFVDNVLLGTELQDEDSTSVRGQLLVSGDSSEWLLTVDSMEYDGWQLSASPMVWRPVNFRGVPQAAPEAETTLPGYMNRGTENNLFIARGDHFEAYDVIPPGQSGQINSDGSFADHYSDQMAMFSGYRYKLIPFSRAEAEQRAQRVQPLLPAAD